MSIGAYTLWIDGQPYGGEAAESEPASAHTGQWWLSRPVETRNRLIVGNCEPYVTEGWRNLGSHIERILARHRDGLLPFTEITIRREAEHD